MQTAAATSYKDSLFLHVYRKISISTEPEILFNLFLVFIHVQKFFLDFIFIFFALILAMFVNNKKERTTFDREEERKYFRDT